VGGDEGDMAVVVDEQCSKFKEGCEMTHASAKEESYMKMKGFRNRHACWILEPRGGESAQALKCIPKHLLASPAHVEVARRVW
jgi:hypothetical protein